MSDDKPTEVEIAERLEKTESILWGLLYDLSNEIPTDPYLPIVKKQIEEYEKQWDDFDGKHTERLEGRGECVHEIEGDPHGIIKRYKGDCGYGAHPEAWVHKWDYCPGCGGRLVIESDSGENE